MSKIGIIIKREYLTRVVKKSFIVMTIIGPILMAAFMIGAAYLAKMDEEQLKEVLVIDQTDAFSKYRLNNSYLTNYRLKSDSVPFDSSKISIRRLPDSKKIKFHFLDKNMNLKEGKEMLKKEEFYALLFIPRNIVIQPLLELYSKKESNRTIVSYVKSKLDSWKERNPDSYISVLVNNAGSSKDMLMVWMEESDWSDVINTNLNSFYYVTSGLIKDMIINKWGRIINIVSLSGLKGLPGQTNYSAAKAGVIGATKALAQEVGKKKITVNAIAPGYIKTEMTKDLDEKQLKKLIPINRFGTPEEVADLVGFLASDSASYITGEVININGGLYT
jgi:3-oxoacyl-[acyl-carrier protein] reductase